MDILKKVPHKIIQVPTGWAWRAPQADFVWIQSALLCHGIRLMDAIETEAREPTVPLDEAIRIFVKSFCRTKEGSYADHKAFCEKFMEYCDVCLKAESINLGPTKLANYIEDIMCWTNRAIRQNNNRLGYLNVCMDVERVDEEIRKMKAEKEAANTSKEDVFDSYIDRFADHVLQTAPPNYMNQ